MVISTVIYWLCSQETKSRTKKSTSSNTKQSIFKYISSVTLKWSFLLHCTIQIPTYDLTHHQQKFW